MKPLEFAELYQLHDKWIMQVRDLGFMYGYGVDGPTRSAGHFQMKAND